MQSVESSRADAADPVVSQPQLPEARWKTAGHCAQLVVVGKQIAELSLVLQSGLIQVVILQLVVVQDEPAQPADVCQERGRQRQDVVALGTEQKA